MEHNKQLMLLEVKLNKIDISTIGDSDGAFDEEF